MAPRKVKRPTKNKTTKTRRSISSKTKKIVPKTLKTKAKKYGVKLTVKRGDKRVAKTEKVLRHQIANKIKSKKSHKRKVTKTKTNKFGATNIHTNKTLTTKIKPSTKKRKGNGKKIHQMTPIQKARLKKMLKGIAVTGTIAGVTKAGQGTFSDIVKGVKKSNRDNGMKLTIDPRTRRISMVSDPRLAHRYKLTDTMYELLQKRKKINFGKTVGKW
jgi:hypothetical protein